ncbi:hypothetical protein KUTeg_009657 [Tegillarca granosa]|uniref:Uncharacterized protein n=1 Tax=Tegillarca granosa TaxID=220873 RepID=A0ABQ9F4M1_TEGGR|nr:hypothetical protein KUTeg_009657 [Tegillarca granosa]
MAFIPYYISWKRFREALKKMPGHPPHWLWGNIHELAEGIYKYKYYPGPNEEGLTFQRESTGLFPKLIPVWFGPFLPMILVHHPETVKVILKSSEPKGRRIYNLIKPWIGDGLLLSKGNKWHRNRRLLTPAFHFDILKPYLKIYNQASDVLLDKLSDYHRKNEYFEVFSVISMFSVDVILQTAFSYKTDCQRKGENHPYVKAVNELVDLITDRFFKFWLHNDFIYMLTSDGRKCKKHCDYVHKVAEEIITKRKSELMNSQIEKKKNLDFLDILLTARDENDEGLTDLEIRDEVDTFLFEGHDTTASATSWILYSLAEHRDIQKKAQEEIDSILDGRDNDEILWEDLPKLTYLTMCIKEGLRLHVPVPFIQRELTKDTEFDGYTVPKGILVNEYIPERFTPENMEKQDSFAFVPFSAGPRNCIGQNFAMHEMKTVVARILRSCHTILLMHIFHRL